MSSSAKVRVLIVDDHLLFREGVARLLSAEPDLEVAGLCGTVEEALRIVRAQPIDIVLLDIDLNGRRDLDFLPLAKEAGFGGRTLILTAGLRDPEFLQLMSSGAAGLFHKHNSPALLVKSIRKVMEGEIWLEQRYLKMLLERNTSGEEQATRPHFTAREREVLEGVFEGLANKEIADRMGLSESSVKAALQQLFHKTGVRTRSQLVRVFLEQYRDEI